MESFWPSLWALKPSYIVILWPVYTLALCWTCMRIYVSHCITMFLYYFGLSGLRWAATSSLHLVCTRMGLPLAACTFLKEGSLHSKSTQRVQSSNSQLIMLCSFNWIHMSSRYELKVLGEPCCASWGPHAAKNRDISYRDLDNYLVWTVCPKLAIYIYYMFLAGLFGWSK